MSFSCGCAGKDGVPEKPKSPRRFRRGLGDQSADQLNASANPTPPPKGGAHERRCGGRGANSWAGECSFYRSLSIALRGKAEMQHVAVGDDVVLAFQPQLADVARTGLAAAFDVVVIRDGLGA